jgi:ribosome-binding protein aMBF1 (putative translation factor)
MDWKTHEKKLMKNPEFRRIWENETRLEYEIARAVILARLNKKITQTQLAKRMKTKQSVISRLESARTTPSVSFLRRLAEVLGGTLKISLNI